LSSFYLHASCSNDNYTWAFGLHVQQKTHVLLSLLFSLLFFLLLSPVHSWRITESTETDRNGPPKSLISTLLLPSAAPRNEDCPTVRIFYWRFLPQNLEILLPVLKGILENWGQLDGIPQRCESIISGGGQMVQVK
jgi:hypothetical protein